MEPPNCSVCVVLAYIQYADGQQTRSSICSSFLFLFFTAPLNRLTEGLRRMYGGTYLSLQQPVGRDSVGIMEFHGGLNSYSMRFPLFRLYFERSMRL